MDPSMDVMLTDTHKPGILFEFVGRGGRILSCQKPWSVSIEYAFESAAFIP